MLRTLGGAVQASLAFAALAVLPQSRLESPRAPRDAAGWVAAYNARDFGQPGVQRVSIELTSGPRVTRRLTVVNAWRADSHRVDSVYFLEAPPGMAGTAYLHSEIAASAPDLSVRLFLPSGQRQVLTVASGEYGEGLLGSDFTYEDFRKRLPMPGYTYVLSGHADIGGEPAAMLDVERPHGVWRRARLWMSSRQPLLLAAEYFHAPGDDRPYKRFRVNRFRVVQGVRSAERMTMTADDGRATVITLLDVKLRVAALSPEVFAPERLARVGDSLSGLLTR